MSQDRQSVDRYFTPKRGKQTRSFRFRNAKTSPFFSGHSPKQNSIIQKQFHSKQNILNKNVIQGFQQKMREDIYKITSKKDSKRQSSLQSWQEAKLSKLNRQKQIISDINSLKYKLQALSLEKEARISKKSAQLMLKNQQKKQYMQQQASQQVNQQSMANLQLPYLYSQYMNHIQNMEALNQKKMKLKRRKKRKDDSQSQSSSSSTEKLNKQSNKKKQKSKLNQTESKRFPSSRPNYRDMKKTNFSKRLKGFNKLNFKEQCIKKMRKYFLAVYFTKCLERLSLKLINQRRNFFQSFWPSQFIKMQENFKQYFFAKFTPFFKLLRSKKQSLLKIQEGDIKDLKIQKVNLIKQLMNVFFECLKSLKQMENLGKLAWSFCKHGAFVEKGVLTVDEVPFVSLSSQYGFLRMDTNLQKSQIVSVIMIKLIIFKHVLHPWRKWMLQFNPSENKILMINVKIIGSIVYRMLLTIQKEFIEQVDERMYPLGNFLEVKQKLSKLPLQCATSLKYQTHKADSELISGLFSETELKKMIPYSSLRNTHNSQLKIFINQIHKYSCAYQKNFKDTVHKKEIKEQYKY